VLAWLTLPFSGAVEPVSARLYPRVFEMSSLLQFLSHTFKSTSTACSQTTLGEVLRTMKSTAQENWALTRLKKRQFCIVFEDPLLSNRIPHTSAYIKLNRRMWMVISLRKRILTKTQKQLTAFALSLIPKW